MQPKTHDDPLSAFVSARPRLFGIAYRVLGSAAEAEDIVQDAWLRWQVTDRSIVLDPPAFPGAPHGITATHMDQVNADLLAFLKKGQKGAKAA